MAQVNKISSFKSFTEVKNQEASMKLREENNAKRQETVGKIGAILDEMGLTSLSELDEDKKQALISKMFGNVSEDEAEEIEDELNKLGEPKKLEEGNAFIYAASKAKQDGKSDFEFNGKTYKVSLKKDTGLKEEFEFDGETYDIEEAKRTKFTGKTAHDLYTQIGGKPVEVFVKNDWYSVNPSELKDDKGNYFTGYTKDGSDYEFELKEIDFIQESVITEGVFYRMPKDIISDELYLTSRNLTNFYDRTAAGNDVDPGVIDTIIRNLEKVKKSVKKFNSKEEVTGTVYESVVNEAASTAGELASFISQNAKHFASFLKPKTLSAIANGNIVEIKPGSKSFTITVDFDKKTIDTTGKPAWPESTSYIEIMEYVKTTKFKLNESVVNEAEKFKSTKDFLDFLEEIDSMPEHRIKRIMGKDYIDTPGGFRDEADDYDNDIEEYTISNMGKKDYEKLKSWWENNVAESVVIESYRIGEDDWQSILSDLKRIGWTIEGWTAIKQIGKSTDRKHIELEYDDNDSVLWTVYVGDTVVKDNGQFNARGLDAKELDKELFKIKGIKESEVTESGFQRSGPSAEATRKAEQLKKLKKLKDREESIARLKKLQLKKHKAANESEVNEAEVSSDEEFKEYAMAVLKKAFGDEFDEAKAEEVVDGILKKCDGDYGAAVGMLTSSLGESVVTEREETQIGTHRYQGKSYPLYTDDEHNHYIKVNGRIIEVDESFVTEAFDANYWEDYQEGAQKMKNPTGMQLQQEVEASVEEWNDNNEMGKENEVTPAGEKKVLKLAKEFVKAKGYISTDIIDAMIAQES